MRWFKKHSCTNSSLSQKRETWGSSSLENLHRAKSESPPLKGLNLRPPPELSAFSKRQTPHGRPRPVHRGTCWLKQLSLPLPAVAFLHYVHCCALLPHPSLCLKLRVEGGGNPRTTFSWVRAPGPHRLVLCIILSLPGSSHWSCRPRVQSQPCQPALLRRSRNRGSVLDKMQAGWEQAGRKDKCKAMSLGCRVVCTRS